MDNSDKKISFRSILKTEAKDATIYTALTFITQLGAFLLIPLFWKKLSPADYGVIAIVDIIAAFISMFGGLFLDQSITRFYYEWPEHERKRRLGALWVAHWASSIGIGAGFIFILSFISHFLFPEVPFYPLIFLGLVNAIFTLMTAVPFSTLRIKRVPWLYALYSLTSFFISIALSIYFVIILNQKLYGYFVGGVISNTVICFISIILMSFFAVPCIRGAGLRESLRFSLPMIPSSIIANITAVADRFILQRFSSLYVLGIYSICLKFAKLIDSLHTALKLSYGPFLFKTVAQHAVEEARTIITRISMFYIIPIFVGGLMVSVFVKDFVHFINRPDYFPVISYVPLLVIPAIIATFYMYFTPGMYVAKRTDLLWITNAVQLPVVLISGLIFIPLLKLEGVIITRYLNLITYIAASFFLSQKVYALPTRWDKVFMLMLGMIAGIGVSDLINFNSVALNLLLKSLLITAFFIVEIIIVVGFSRTYNFFVSTLEGKNIRDEKFV